ncbi:phosphatase PAP2 family protein [Flavitalea flava]
MILLDNGMHTGFLYNILQGDHWLFNKINQDWTNPLFDNFLPYLRESEIWLPFYLFLLVFITLNFGKKGWFWSFSLIMTAIIGDLVSSHLIKQNLFRLRPCQDPEMASLIRILVNYCPSSSSFTSSHACNHFALSTFIYLTLHHTSRWWGVVFAWAFFISYAQIYVGVHYPVDVICGALIGCLIGYGTSRLFHLQFGTLSLPFYKQTHA